MFGVGPQEMVVVGLLLLIVFGANNVSTMARDLGRFVNGSQRIVEEVKSELVSEEVEEVRRTVEDVKSELVSGGERDVRRRKQ